MPLPIALLVLHVLLGTNVPRRHHNLLVQQDISPLAVRLLAPSALPAHIVQILRLAQ